jgi:Xaa-Pro dipeptidase
VVHVTHIPLLILDNLLSEQKIDAILVRLPEHVVYLTGTLPVAGVSLAFYRPGMEPRLLQPECELQWVKAGGCIPTSFGWGHLPDRPIEQNQLDWMQSLAAEFGDDIRTLGVEIDFGTTAPSFSSAENLLPDNAWRTRVADAFHGTQLIDVVPVLVQARACKCATELDLLRRTNRIAQLGLDALSQAIRPGLREVDAAALVESTIRSQGTGFDGARLVRAWAHITSGPEGTYRQSMLTPSSERAMQAGDLVMIEMAVCADGYWSDLTRVYCVGEPTVEQIRLYNAVLAAQQAGAAQLIPGKTWGDPDRAGRLVLEQAGLDVYFKHGTGHGVGYRYHETIPQLGPGNTGLLCEGMVTSVEPGIYLPGVGGIRIEDNVAIGPKGPIFLSQPCQPW